MATDTRKMTRLERLRWAMRRGELHLSRMSDETLWTAEDGRELRCGTAPWSPSDDGWAEYDCPRTYALASEAARGSYQQGLLDGTENLSGSLLRGRALQYKARYHASQRRLLERVAELGLIVDERRGEHGRRVLVITRRADPRITLRVEEG